jgi:hypothetical protein
MFHGQTAMFTGIVGNDGGSYDRINKLLPLKKLKDNGISGLLPKMYHQADLTIYLNGDLWHSGTGK